MLEAAVDSHPAAAILSAANSYERSSSADSPNEAASSASGWTAFSTAGASASTTGAPASETQAVASMGGAATPSTGVIYSTGGMVAPSSSGKAASSSRPTPSSSSGHQPSQGLPASRRLAPSSSAGDSLRRASLSAKPAAAKSGNAGTSIRRKSLALTHEAGALNRLELSPVLEGAVNDAGARQELLPSRTPRAVPSGGGDGVGTNPAAGVAGSSAVGYGGTVGAATAGITAAGGISMQTPRSSTTSGRRVQVKGKGCGQGQNDVDDFWSDDDGIHCSGNGRGHRINQSNGSWGGCSTIKRRADDMNDHTHGVSTGYGGRGVGPVHRGNADDDGHGNLLGRGLSNRSGLSSSSSLSSGDVSLRSTVGGVGDGVGRAGAKQTPQAGWRRGAGARESYGRGALGGGRADYHSLCFSSSSSGYSASSSSPFGLLDSQSTPDS